MPVVGTLIFEMAADVARLRTDMQKAQSTVSGAMSGMKDAAAIATRALGALGIAVGAHEFAAMVRGSLDAVNALHELAIKTGNTTEALGSLRAAARASHTEMEQVATGLQFLSKNMNEVATTGKGKAAVAFEELGIVLVDTSGKLRNNVDVMHEVAEKLMTMEDRTKAVALAKTLLGKAGANLLPLFTEMIRLGKQQSSVSNEQGEAAHEFMVKLGQLEARTATLKREFSLGLLPALNSIAAALLDTETHSDDAGSAGRAFGQVVRWLAQIATGAWSAFELFGKTLATLAATQERLIRLDFKGALRAWAEGAKDVADTAARAGERIKKMGEEAAKLPDPPARRSGAPGRSRGGAPAPEESSEGTDEGESFAPRPGLAASFAGTASLNRTLRDTRDLGKEVGDVMEAAGVRGARGMKSLEDVVKRLALELIRATQRQIASGGIGGIDIGAGAGEAVKSVFGGVFGGMFADGGQMSPGTWNVVGEQGPELVYSGGGGTVVPNGALGGDTFHFNVDMRGAPAETVQRLEALVNSVNGSLERRAVAAVQRASNLRGYVTATG